MTKEPKIDFENIEPSRRSPLDFLDREIKHKITSFLVDMAAIKYRGYVKQVGAWKGDNGFEITFAFE